MAWEVRRPQRPDFCGCPPCPLCYVWVDENHVDLGISLQKFTQDLLQTEGKPTVAQLIEGKKAAQALHERVQNAPLSTEPPPDIADNADLNAAMLRQIHREKTEPTKRKPRVLTCDEIADRQEAIEKAAAEEAAVKAKEVEKQRVEAEKEKVGAQNAYDDFLARVARERQERIEAEQRVRQMQQAAAYQQGQQGMGQTGYGLGYYIPNLFG